MCPPGAERVLAHIHFARNGALKACIPQKDRLNPDYAMVSLRISMSPVDL